MLLKILTNYERTLELMVLNSFVNLREIGATQLEQLISASAVAESIGSDGCRGVHDERE